MQEIQRYLPATFKECKRICEDKLQLNQEFLQKMEFKTLKIGLILQPYKISITNIFLAGTIPEDKCEENNGYNSDQILEEFMEYEDRQFLTILMCFFSKVFWIPFLYFLSYSYSSYKNALLTIKIK